MITETQTLSTFFRTIWREEKGFVYIALKAPSTGKWGQKFFEWPVEESSIIRTVLSERTANEVYFGPALYEKPNDVHKPNCKGSNVVWMECDGKIPIDFGELPSPSLVVQTSDETHQHMYWCLSHFTDAATVEKINRSLTYKFEADASGWDCTQVLRPPETLNHKKSRRVEQKITTVEFYEVSSFSKLEAPAPIETLVPTSIPSIAEIIPKYAFSADIMNLFRNGAPVGSRSSALMALGYALAEMNLNNGELFSMLISADERWGKFAKRSDRDKRLLEIVTRARQKFPYKNQFDAENAEAIEGMGLLTLLATEVQLEWVWEGLLQKAGYFLLTGPSGVGKTLLTLEVAAHMALGKDYLGYAVNGPVKIGFLSLEMGLVDIKFFLQLQKQNYSEEELAILEKNLIIYPIGEPLYCSQIREKIRVEKMIEKDNLDGLMFDSLGSMSAEELTSEREVKNIMDWNDRLRNHYGLFTWYVHHHRKAQASNKRPNKLSDVYGNQYITARATTVLCMWGDAGAQQIQMHPLKVRLAKRPNPFIVTRDATLGYQLKTGAIPVDLAGVGDTEDEEIDVTTPTPETATPITENDFGTMFEC